MALRYLFRPVLSALLLKSIGDYTTRSGSSDPTNKVSMHSVQIERSAYLKRGLPYPFIAHEDNRRDTYWIRVDMPGAVPELTNINVVNNQVHFSGSEVPGKVPGMDTSPRTYSATIDLDPARFRTHNHSAQLLNGVLWFEFHRVHPSPAVYRDRPFEIELQGWERDMSWLIFNPFVCKGIDRDFSIYMKKGGDAVVLQVDMPGLSNEDHTLTVEGGKISFRGEASRSSMDPFGMDVDHAGLRRVYEGSLEVDLEGFDAENAKSVVEYGVLWVEVPKRMREPGNKLRTSWVRVRNDRGNLEFRFRSAEIDGDQ